MHNGRYDRWDRVAGRYLVFQRYLVFHRGIAGMLRAAGFLVSAAEARARAGACGEEALVCGSHR